MRSVLWRAISDTQALPAPHGRAAAAPGHASSAWYTFSFHAAPDAAPGCSAACLHLAKLESGSSRFGFDR
jgi:hypothetical protein